MNSGTPMMTFILGGLVVIVLVMAFFMYNGSGQSSTPTIINRTVTVQAPRPEHHWWQFAHDNHDAHNDQPRGH
jgi:hypothetical protein